MERQKLGKMWPFVDYWTPEMQVAGGKWALQGAKVNTRVFGRSTKA
jgi:hypothetical protein